MQAYGQTTQQQSSQNIKFTMEELLRRITMESLPRGMSGIVIVKRMNKQITVGKQIKTLAGIRRKLLIEKAG